MAFRSLAAEVAADAVLIGRYFGRTSATSSISRPAAATSSAAFSLASRNTPSITEGDGPGVRMMASSGGTPSFVVGMSSAATAERVGSVRFMSMFGSRRADDPVIANEISKYF